MATALHMNSMVVSEEQKFKLDDVRGSVHMTQKIMLGPFESRTLSGILKGPVRSSAYHKHVNVPVEPLEAHKEGGKPIVCCFGIYLLKARFRQTESND